ncbi:MAG TPA: NAD(P)-dependent oxidoreductase [Acidobacteriaceae bacterium]|nr:NAD(P)-dependent oxidoreductase [Acidobacteriaceae bacterium]
MNLRTCVIFGGTGCIGTHIAKHLLEHTQVERIYLADIRPLRDEAYVKPLLRWIESTGGAQPRVVYVECDVRLSLDGVPLPQQVDLIINLAAVHREPGHEPNEYYETNLPGAEHICAYATHAGCFRIVFTSSISPYGSSDAARNEDSLTIPETAYGGSKLVAEKIHAAWQHANPNRRLIVLRPGVVFGPGEHANVARLVRSLERGYFVYMGNRSTRKAGVYVKELCHVMQFAIEHQERAGEPILLWNVSMDPPPTLEEFVNAVCSSMKYRQPRWSVPRNLLVAASYPVAGIAQLFGVHTSVNPLRMRKLSQSTFIEPKRLRDAGYRFRYTLEQAMTDWKQDAPGDFDSRGGMNNNSGHKARS